MDFISHHGIKGQKWGVRRYQNPDGSYTTEGLKRRHKFLIERDGSKYIIRDSNGEIASSGSRYEWNLDNFQWDLIADLDTNAIHRGKGFATAIIKQMEKDSRNNGNGLYLLVADSNDNAIRLYDKLGFETVKTQTIDNKHYYVMGKGSNKDQLKT